MKPKTAKSQSRNVLHKGDEAQNDIESKQKCSST
ncbi:hypothetical protein J2S19_003009 [Metabacillus malikii]|uniref:Uncharacterized protein n=1 Tax=Metabacillus malikii TaxID=1504265 RepID=A0ABT9ZKH6_9BACI|nr:hypothetical protein [Metabacillus malikii]